MKFDINDLDFKNMGSWPLPAKVVAIAIICAVVLLLGYWFDVRDQLDVLNAAEAREMQLKETFESKQRAAANLVQYREQMEEIRTSFGALLRQLPSKTEIADILVDISRLGIGNGLEFELFKPEAEIPQEFYAELPIKIKVTGDYHKFGKFASDIAALPRIVTLHDLSITPTKDKEGAAQLTMEATAKTYRYLDEAELAAAKAKNAPAKKAARK